MPLRQYKTIIYILPLRHQKDNSFFFSRALFFICMLSHLASIPLQLDYLHSSCPSPVSQNPSKQFAVLPLANCSGVGSPTTSVNRRRCVPPPSLSGTHVLGNSIHCSTQLNQISVFALCTIGMHSSLCGLDEF